MHGSPSPNHGFARSLVQTAFLALAAAFTAAATKGAPAWPALLELPAYPGVSSPGSPGFPGLPEVLRHFDFDAGQPDGEPVRDAADWWLQRRPEVLAMLRHYMYGEEPPAPADIAFTVQSVDTGALSGLATRKIIVGDFAPAGTAPFRFVLYLPNDREGPVPVLLALNAQGEARIEPGADRANRWDLPGAMEAGVAIATVEVREFASDGGGFRDALINPLAAAGFEGDWKGIAAWAWGLARVVDYLVTDPAIDPYRIGVTGYSRRGKAALWAGALDDRMALVIPHQSGHGGAHSSRRRWGGTFGTQFPHWFLDRYVYVDAADYDRLPFDQHFVIAAIAPRRVLLSENRSYGDNLNGMLAMMAGARPVWALLGSDPETGVHLALKKEPTAQPRFFRLRYAIRYEDGPLQIIRHPADQTVMEGERVSFAVELNGRPISAAEWRHNGVPLPGEHHTFLSLREVVPGDSGYYTYHAWKGDAEVSSLPALLNVIPNTTAAHILEVRFVAPEYVKIRFSEAVAAGGGPHGAENPANYHFSDGLTVVTAAFAEGDPTRVRLRVAGAILGQDYTLTVSALANRAATPVLSPVQDLLLRQDAVVRINFQPPSPPPPPGWLIDHGALFGPRADGWTYGWAGEPGTARQRNSASSSDFLHDTLIHAGPQEFADDPDWSIALPNGTYRVRLVLGDPQYFDNEFSVLAQGNLILSGTANRDLRWIEGTALVEVTDGTLTLSKGASARRNKFAFIEIRLAPGSLRSLPSHGTAPAGAPGLPAALLRQRA